MAAAVSLSKLGLHLMYHKNSVETPEEHRRSFKIDISNIHFIGCMSQVVIKSYTSFYRKIVTLNLVPSQGNGYFFNL